MSVNYKETTKRPNKIQSFRDYTFISEKIKVSGQLRGVISKINCEEPAIQSLS